MNESPRTEFAVLWWYRGYSHSCVVIARSQRRAEEKLAKKLLSMGLKNYAVEYVRRVERDIPF